MQQFGAKESKFEQNEKKILLGLMQIYTRFVTKQSKMEQNEEKTLKLKQKKSKSQKVTKYKDFFYQIRAKCVNCILCK